jgi:hypothetical protein
MTDKKIDYLARYRTRYRTTHLLESDPGTSAWEGVLSHRGPSDALARVVRVTRDLSYRKCPGGLSNLIVDHHKILFKTIGYPQNNLLPYILECPR